MKKKDEGFISLIIVLILGLAAAKYFLDWSVVEALESEEGKGTMSYIGNVLSACWSYVDGPVNWIWDEVVWPLCTFIGKNIGVMGEK